MNSFENYLAKQHMTNTLSGRLTKLATAPPNPYFEDIGPGTEGPRPKMSGKKKAIIAALLAAGGAAGGLGIRAARRAKAAKAAKEAPVQASAKEKIMAMLQANRGKAALAAGGGGAAATLAALAASRGKGGE